jgi:IclR family transcriptional regulator, acetate operon repressor
MSVKSIEKTLSTLDFFINNINPSGLSLKEICAGLGFKKSAAHHMLATVCQKGYLYQDLKTKKYLIGSKIKKMSKLGLVDDNSFLDFASEHLKRVNDETGESVHLAGFEGTRLITLLMLESKHPVRVDHGFLNKDHAFHATASGKAILAHMNLANQEKILKRNRMKFTEFTLVDKNILSKELITIKKNGYAIDDEEFQEGVYCVGYPVFDKYHDPVASVSCSSPKYKIMRDKKYLDKIKNLTHQAAVEISKYYQPKKIIKKGEKKYAA